ncbi:carboxymuconolactone decarboxylase family protein [Insolitispirillum peregrinum]|uniref:Alkylhydroperoxidase AhpD family core domain-containing protein n=1 Tax=Insolitispirillum peregrinum TaxID=80876 RepID=A0A1N7KDR8_9PROT|nr:carboxymuconolactone decarboxylase family protein [Insolitispirillum peregrinum]SIS59745.1 alkylhydroperoxidase AhpD family core domain-containing protein [Insolitispirillum peregrinum]
MSPLLSYADFAAHIAGVPDGLRVASQAVSVLDPALVELVKLRASHLNACTFCTHYHLALARKLGVPQDKLDLLSVWREAPQFSAQERAALAWTEVLTLMADHPERAAAEAEVTAHFAPAELAALTSAIAIINAWNRIAGGLRFSV